MIPERKPEEEKIQEDEEKGPKIQEENREELVEVNK